LIRLARKGDWFGVDVLFPCCASIPVLRGMMGYFPVCRDVLSAVQSGRKSPITFTGKYGLLGLVGSILSPERETIKCAIEDIG
jgi:hypothetical protein